MSRVARGARASLASAALVLWTATTTAHAAPAPHLHFRTIATPCCDVHFPEAQATLGARVADMVDECVANTQEVVRGRLSQRVQIVLTDVTDSPNGFANVVPYNRVELRAITPEDDSELAKTDDWLRLLVQHELLHISHLDVVHGLPAAVNLVVGKVWPPNSVQPRMVVEGLAVYAETRFTKGGRLRSTLFRAPLRVAALRGDRWSLDDVANVSRRPPGGSAAYVYGSAFVEWLTARYGTQLWAAYAHAYGTTPIPYTVQRTLEEFTGADLTADWSAFLDDVLREAKVVEAEVRARGGPTPARRLTRLGGGLRRPAFLKDGSLVFGAKPPDGPAGVYALRGLPRAIPTPDPLLRTTDLADVAVVGDDIVFSQTETHERWFSFRDLFVRSPDGRVRQLTFGARVKNPAPLPTASGRRVVLAEQRTGSRSAIVSVDVDSGAIADVVVAPAGEVYYGPRASPDGERVVVSRLGTDGLRQVVVLDLVTGARASLVHDADGARHDQLDPIFIDDDTLLYTEDLDGVFNVFSLHLSTGERRRVVDTLGGAAQPTPTPDGHFVVYTDLHLDGVDFHVARLDAHSGPALGVSRLVEEGTRAEPQTAAPPAAPVSTPYSPWSTIWPRTYQPGIQGDLLGGVAVSMDISGSDAAELVSWSLRGAIDSVFFKPALVSSVRLTNLTLPVSAVAELRPVISDRARENDGLPELHVEDQLRAAVAVAVPIRRRRFSHSVSLGAQRVQSLDETGFTSTPDALRPRYPQSVTQPVTQAVTVDWSYSGVESYRDSVSTEWGFSSSLRLRLADRVAFSDVDIREVTFDARAFQPVPGLTNHVVAAYLSGGAAFDDRPGAVFFQGGFVGRSVLQDVFDGSRSGGGALRGFPIAHVVGDALAAATLEYRLPLLEVERGIETLPMFVERLHGAAFVDMATAFDERPGTLRVATSAGAELRLNLILGYYGAFLVRLGYARGLTAGGIDQPYALLGIPY